MLKQKRFKKATAAFLALTFLAVWLTMTLCTVTVSAENETTGTIKGVDDLVEKTIGVQLGTTGDTFATDYEKDGTARVERYNKAADAVQALKQHKVDCVIIDEQPALSFVAVNDDIKILEEEFAVETYALCVKKGNSELLGKINTALQKLKADGTIANINTNYIGTDEQKGTMPYQKKDVQRTGDLIVATNAEFKPYEYIENNQIVGIDMDIMQAICDELSMNLVIENMAFDSILPAIQSGKATVGAAGMTVTEDRKKNVDFSDSYTTSKQVIIVNDEKTSAANNTINSVDDLIGKNIGVQLGTTGDTFATDYEKDGTANLERYTKAADAIQALNQNKIDCVIIDEQPALSFVALNSNLAILEEEFAVEEYALCVKKGNSELLSEINEALKKLKADGTLDTIATNYIGTDEQKGTMPYQKKDVQRNGKLVVATNAEFKPYEYIENNQIVGIDMDIMQAICDELGLEMEIENMAFDSILPAIQSGKADVGAAGMTVTEDRKQNVDFSDSYTTSKQVIIINKGTSSASDSQKNTKNLSFTDKLRQNFVEDNRWQYILAGLGNTLLITLLAIIIGLVIGTLVAVVRTIHDQQGKLKILNVICKIYLAVIRGTPAMIQLLIIYYVIFASVNVSKVLVAVVAFGLNSGAYVAEVIRSGINAVDEGQFEAGRCLGLNYRQTMTNIIMPQAFKNMLPALCNEFISLLKETAISGYIGLQDLTKGGDIIRSQTFEAFIPLVAVALIYLVMVLLLSYGVSRLERSLKKNER